MLTDASISTPSAAAAMFFAALPADAREERVFVLPLDGSGRVIAKPILVSLGHEDGTAQIDAGAIFREMHLRRSRQVPRRAQRGAFAKANVARGCAFKAGAEEIIVAHNHPSGDPTPSKADCDTTVRLNEGASLVGLELIDHIILGSVDSANGLGFVSMAELMAE